MHSIETIPEGRAGLDIKCRRIRELVESAKRDPAFRARAAEIVAGVPEKDHDGEIGTVFDYVRDGIRYLRDPWSPDGLELFTTPQRLLQDIDEGVAAGDCDDHVILCSALLETVGYPTRFRIGGLPPDHFRHIWLEVRHPRKGWLPLELVNKDEGLGFDPSGRFPLTLTLDGVAMFNHVGLGAQGGFARRNTGAYSRRQMASMETRRVRVQADLIGRQPGRHRGGALGDYELPPSYDRIPQSFDNTPMQDRWEAAGTPSDLWREQELGDLGSLRKAFKKATKSVSKATKGVARGIGQTASTIGKAGKLMLNPMAAVTSLVQRRSSGGQESGGAPGNYTSPGSGGGFPPGTFTPPPSAYEPAGGDPMIPAAGGGGSYDMTEPMEPMAPEDEWGPWDADSEEQEEHSLYTPATAAEFGPDMVMPGQGRGSFVPTPGWPPPVDDPFSEPVSGAEGMDYDSARVDDPTAVYGETSDTMGDWMTDLVSQVGSTVLTYQQARLQAQAAKRGYPALNFGTTLPPNVLPPAPIAPAATPPPQTIMLAPPPEPQRMRSSAMAGMGKYGPLIMLGIGGVVLFALVKSRRR